MFLQIHTYMDSDGYIYVYIFEYAYVTTSSL